MQGRTGNLGRIILSLMPLLPSNIRPRIVLPQQEQSMASRGKKKSTGKGTATKRWCWTSCASTWAATAFRQHHDHKLRALERVNLHLVLDEWSRRQQPRASLVGYSAEYRHDNGLSGKVARDELRVAPVEFATLGATWKDRGFVQRGFT